MLGIADAIAELVRGEARRWTDICWNVAVSLIQQIEVPASWIALVLANIAACQFLHYWFTMRVHAPALATWSRLGAAYHVIVLLNVVVNHTLNLEGALAAIAEGTYATMTLVLLDSIVRDRQVRRLVIGAWVGTLMVGIFLATVNHSWRPVSTAVSIIGAFSVLALCLLARLPGPAQTLIFIYPLCLSLRPLAQAYPDLLLSYIHLAGLVGKVLLATAIDINRLVPGARDTPKDDDVTPGQLQRRFRRLVAV